MFSLIFMLPEFCSLDAILRKKMGFRKQYVFYFYKSAKPRPISWRGSES